MFNLWESETRSDDSRSDWSWIINELQDQDTILSSLTTDGWRKWKLPGILEKRMEFQKKNENSLPSSEYILISWIDLNSKQN